MTHSYFATCSLFILAVFSATASELPTTKTHPVAQFKHSTLQAVAAKHGDQALQRIQDWQALITKNQGKSEWQNLHRVNRFFNKIDFVSDAIHWQQEDYWATPIEFLATKAGDCEDFSIAKYITLLSLGIPPEKLQLMHVSTLPKKTRHMVVVYMEDPDAVPLVLDNLIKKILPINQRSDLVPSYSFSTDGLWLPGKQGPGRKIKDSAGIALWDDVIDRIQRGL